MFRYLDRVHPDLVRGRVSRVGPERLVRLRGIRARIDPVNLPARPMQRVHHRFTGPVTVPPANANETQETEKAQLLVVKSINLRLRLLDEQSRIRTYHLSGRKLEVP